MTKVIALYRKGYFGNKKIPEDIHPDLRKMSNNEILLYYTLPMALNYRRNSFLLWKSANKTYQDSETNFVFYPEKIVNMSFEEVQKALRKYNLAI